jgi:hypothetical protein
MTASITSRALRTAALGVSIFALPSAASALQVFNGTRITHPHPSGLSGDAEKVVIGQLTDDATRDVAILQGNTIFLLDAPARQSSCHVAVGTYTDLALLPDGGLAGRDGLVAIAPEGVVRLHWNGSVLVETVLASSDSWASAHFLQVTPCALGSHVAAVTSGGEVVRGEYDAGSFTELEPLRFGLSPLAFAALEFDASSGVEYAFDDGSGLQIYSENGELIHASIPNSSAAPLLLRLPEVGSTYDALVWLTSAAPSVQLLTVARTDEAPPYARYEPFMVVSLPVEEIALADYFGDGHLDLLGVSAVDPALRVLKNQSVFVAQPLYTFDLPLPDTFQFDATHVYGSGWSTAPALAVGDLDGDGDADPVLAGHAATSGEVEVLLSDGIDESAWRAELNPSIHQNLDCLEYYETENPATAHFKLEIFAPLEPTSHAETHIAGAVWVQNQEGGSLWTCAYPFLEPISGSLPTKVWPEVPVSTVSLGGTPPEIFWVQFWAVRRVSGKEVWSGPATTVWFSRLEFAHDPGTIGGYNDPPVIQPGP